jgi:hypothetical protein
MAMQPGRYEKRSTEAVAVLLTNPNAAVPTELTLTENISQLRTLAAVMRVSSPRDFGRQMVLW